jgi:hypothetical protein
MVKVSGFVSLGIPNNEDLVHVVDDPSGTPASRRTTIGAIRSGGAVQVSTGTTLDSSHSIVNVDTSSGAVTITLPSCASVIGKSYFIRRDGANSVTVDSGTDTYSDTGTATDRTLGADASAIWLFSVGGTEWKIALKEGTVT